MYFHHVIYLLLRRCNRVLAGFKRQENCLVLFSVVPFLSYYYRYLPRLLSARALAWSDIRRVIHFIFFLYKEHKTTIPRTTGVLWRDVIIHFLLAKKIPSWVQAASWLRDHVLHEFYEGTSLWMILANCKSFLQSLLPVQTHTRTPTPVHPHPTRTIEHHCFSI